MVYGLPALGEVNWKGKLDASIEAVKATADAALPAATAAATYAPIAAIGASVYRTTNQTIPTGAATAVSWEAEAFDTNGFWDAAAPTRLTVPAGQGGLYVATVNGEFENNATGDRAIHIQLNGGEYVAVNAIASGATARRILCSAIVSLVPGDYLEAPVYQDSGGSRLYLAAVAGVSSLGYYKFSVAKLGK